MEYKGKGAVRSRSPTNSPPQAAESSAVEGEMSEWFKADDKADDTKGREPDSETDPDSDYEEIRNEEENGDEWVQPTLSSHPSDAEGGGEPEVGSFFNCVSVADGLIHSLHQRKRKL